MRESLGTAADRSFTDEDRRGFLSYLTEAGLEVGAATAAGAEIGAIAGSIGGPLAALTAGGGALIAGLTQVAKSGLDIYNNI
jgi:hypothetical protein